MSRLIVKNLPKDMKEDRFRSVFSSKGEITDVRLCKTKEGKFRRFGFVGFKTVEEAENAMKYFNNSFIDTSKIQIEVARNLGETTFSRPWSKYSEGSSAYQKIAREKLEKETKLFKQNNTEGNKSLEKRDKKEKNESHKQLNEMEDDPEFQEFLLAHEHRTKKSLFGNENFSLSNINKQDNKQDTARQKSENAVDSLASVSSSEEEIDDGSMSEETDSDDEANPKASKNASNLSDMDYLKSKIVSKGDDDDDNDDDDLEKTDKDDEGISDEDESSEDESEREETPLSSLVTTQKQESIQSQWTVKMRGLPFKIKDKHILQFFSPIKCVSIRFVKNKKGQPSGRAFVDFQCKEDLEKALKRDKDYLQGRYIELFKDDHKTIEEIQNQPQKEKLWVKKLKESGNSDEEDESIGESGRLFLRNLAYTCTEDDVQKLFEKHGPLSEVNLPLDKNTNKTIGIGYVTFLMPEHAVKAFNELDGHVFQGRLLHILPSKAKRTEEDVPVESSSYKKKSEAQKKAQSSSDHNWNTLFLGVNAVADAMAEKYNTTKRGILDAESSNSLAVRMALGETQVVADTRKFLVENGVKLDVFGQPTSKRSKTVILAKNLPYGTSTDELNTLFSHFGQLQRIVLPPTGITALVEFQEPSIARKAFQKLAYTKFKNSLLYLEWAPLDVFVEANQKVKTNEQDTKKDGIEDKDEDSSEEESETDQQDGKTLFVKNLNFETSEEVLREKFSQAGDIKSVTIARKKDPKKQGALLSMGYGFVEFKKKSSALKALKELQNCKVNDHALELKISHRKSSEKDTKRQRASTNKQKSSKILVRNVPFEATTKELRELFSTFGEIKTLRLPKKMVGTGPHRGFAFVDFLTKQDAKRAFEALSTSTHLYGRRLVLEWAEEEDDLDTLRKRTAKHFQEPKLKTKKKKEIMDELLEME